MSSEFPNLGAFGFAASGSPPAPESIYSPLSEFYADLGLPLPAIRILHPDHVPEPYRRLLVHDRDMTPTLEAAHRGKIHLRVLRYAADENIVSRLVALAMEDETKVEVGAIRIFLHRLPHAARQPILEHWKPFGSILQEHSVTHRCRPAAYFQVAADAMLAEALEVNSSESLYGRRNTIWNSHGEVLAEVVEILPPYPRVLNSGDKL